MKRLGLFPNLNKAKVREALPGIIELCRKYDIEPWFPREYERSYSPNLPTYGFKDKATLRQLDAAVSLGGDGTLLRLAGIMLCHEVPIFGINFGKLGFLAELDLDNLEQALEHFSKNNCAVEKRSVLKATVITDDREIIKAYALNDIVLAKGIYSKLARFNMYINGKPSGNYSADGLIVSTATGSTAYCLAAGGPLVMPELDVSIITPVCAHSLSSRTLIIPSTEIIELRGVAGSEEMMLSADGKNVSEVDEFDVVRIEKSSFSLKLLRLTDTDYYQTWQQKLMRNI